MTALVAVPGVEAFAQEDDGGGESSGSLAQQVLAAADDALGADAAVAVVRAYDRGYDLLQIIEALFDGFVADDGTTTDDEGVSLAPFREPTNVIEENATTRVRLVAVDGALIAGPEGSGETIALDVLERGIQKTTKRLDKKFDLEGRAERSGVSDASLLTMLDVFLLIEQGYSPEQVIVDGFAAGGIKGVPGPPGALLVDEHGKRIKPDGVEESPEHEEAAEQLESFAGDILDAVAGIDPFSAADLPFKPQLDVEIEIVLTSDANETIVGKGRIGFPRKKSQRGYVIGNGKGELTGAGACSLSEGGIAGDANSHPWEVSGNLQLGFSGVIDDSTDPATAAIRIALINFSPTVTGDDSLCVDVVRDTAGAVATQTFGPVRVRLRKGAEATSESTFGDAAVTTKVTLS